MRVMVLAVVLAGCNGNLFPARNQQQPEWINAQPAPAANEPSQYRPAPRAARAGTNSRVEVEYDRFRDAEHATVKPPLIVTSADGTEFMLAPYVTTRVAGGAQVPELLDRVNIMFAPSDRGSTTLSTFHDVVVLGDGAPCPVGEVTYEVKRDEYGQLEIIVVPLLLKNVEILAGLNSVEVAIGKYEFVLSSEEKALLAELARVARKRQAAQAGDAAGFGVQH